MALTAEALGCGRKRTASFQVPASGAVRSRSPHPTTLQRLDAGDTPETDGAGGVRRVLGRLASLGRTLFRDRSGG